ncbi:SpoIID/LytB domain-containing protein [bacterium]|nr:SpoIID/LytB domain-containing protein [bacterium]
MSSEDISILVAGKQNTISIKATDFTIIDERVGDILYKSKKTESIKFQYIKGDENRTGIKFNNRFYPTEGFIIESPNEFYINGKKLKFKLSIVIFNNTLYAINILPVESYLAGIINAEISSKWPIEAIKAQSVVSRTFALRKKIYNFTKPYDLDSSVLDQVYKGISIIDEQSVKAVRETYGEVLVYQNQLIQAFFHANSAGYTEGAEYFAGNRLPYLISVKDPYSLNKPRDSWSYQIKISELEKTLLNLYKIGGKIKKISIKEQNERGRVMKLLIETTQTSYTITGEHFRRALGYTNIFSTKFKLFLSKEILRVEGSGSGHGVGMSQWGAFEMAKQDKRYKEILNFYFTNVRVLKMY